MHSRILISIALLAVFTIAFVYCTNEQPPKAGGPRHNAEDHASPNIHSGARIDLYA